MGTLLEVRCGDCGAVSEQVDGMVMSGYLPRCADCGQTRLVSPSDVHRAESATDTAKRPSTDDAWEREDRIVCEVAGTCACGGQFAPDAPIRCSACRSRSVTTAMIGLAD